MTPAGSGEPHAFSVVVVPYDPAWPGMFDAERARLRSSLDDLGPAIEHIGSTSVPGLAAKPKIDILVGLRDWIDLASAIERLLRVGYEHEPQLALRRQFSMKRGHPTTHRVHFVEAGGELWNDYLAFRDALRADPDLRARYSELKHELAQRHSTDHHAYMEAKTSFIEGVIERERGGRRPAPATSSTIQRAFPTESAARRLRQWPTLRALVEFAWQMELYLGVLLIGSFAQGTADDVSDLDLILITRDEGFADAWTRREELQITGALAAFDERSEGQVGAHKWITKDGIFVECLIADPASGVRIAQPFLVVAGEPNLPDRLGQRPPILRSEMGQARHPLERAYDELKAAVRSSRPTTPRG